MTTAMLRPGQQLVKTGFLVYLEFRSFLDLFTGLYYPDRSALSSPVPIYTERHCESEVSCPITQHKVLGSGVERTNHGANAPHTEDGYTIIITAIIYNARVLPLFYALN